MAHNRKLVLGGVALTKARLPARQSALAMGKARDDIEKELIESNYLNNAPFRWIGLIIREGITNETEPHYGNIDQNDGELPLAIEIDTQSLVGLDQNRMTAIYRKAALVALVHAGDKYRLPISRLRDLLEIA